MRYATSHYLYSCIYVFDTIYVSYTVVYVNGPINYITLSFLHVICAFVCVQRIKPYAYALILLIYTSIQVPRSGDENGTKLGNIR